MLSMKILKFKKKSIHSMISYTRIAAQKVVEGLVATLPTYLKHMKDSNAVLVEDIQRLSNNYLLSETDVSHVHRLQAELESLEESVLELTSEQRGTF